MAAEGSSVSPPGQGASPASTARLAGQPAKPGPKIPIPST